MNAQIKPLTIDLNAEVYLRYYKNEMMRIIQNHFKNQYSVKIRLLRTIPIISLDFFENARL